MSPSVQARRYDQFRLFVLSRLSNPLSVLYFFGLFLCLAFAVESVRQSAYFADVFVIAERIEESRQFNTETLAKTSKLAREVVKGDYCRSDIVMAGATVVLGRLDRTDQINDYRNWSDAVDDAADFLKHAISCMPGESNFWLRLAMVESVIAQNPETISSLMSISARLAPADEIALVSRLYMWNHLASETLDVSHDTLIADMNVLLKNGDPARITPILGQPSLALAPYSRNVVTKLSDSRRQQLRRSGLAIDAVM